MELNPNKIETSDRNEYIRSQKLVKSWFEKERGRISRFYKKYYDETDKPSYKWVVKVIKAPSRPDKYNIWLNAFEYFLSEKAREEKLMNLSKDVVEVAS